MDAAQYFRYGLVMETSPIAIFKSHVDGKNADVAIYPDRVEWAKESFLGTGGKLVLGVATGGVSLFKTGVSGKLKGTEMIAMKSISSVTSKRDGIRFTAVAIIGTGNTISFRVSHADAIPMRELLTSLVLGTHDSQIQSDPPNVSPSSAAVSTAANPTPPSIADELRKLAALRDDGILTEEDFQGQKQRLLSS
jgi:Short C-terminal domain